MNIKKAGLLFTALAAVWMLLTACGIGQPGSSATEATPTPGAGVTSLWPDVPPFPGATQDPTISSFLNQTDSKTMTMQYFTDKKPAEVTAFYTNDFMKEQGWVPQPYDIVKLLSSGHGEGPQTHNNGMTSGGCILDITGRPLAFCSFSKTDEKGQDVELTINISLDVKTNQTMLVYVRTIGSNPKK